MPRKSYTRSTNPSNFPRHKRIINWVRFNLINSIIITLVLVALILYLSIVIRSDSEKQTIPESNTNVIKQVHTEENNSTILLKRIEALEKQVEDQQKVISWYDTYNQTSQTNFKKLDKNQQIQIETLKRICEYIWVITIDKKIVPRQCYSDYNWRREELNGN